MRETRYDSSEGVVAVTNLQAFFHEAVDGAMRNQRVQVAEHTAHYVVSLLTLFARSEALYDQADEGRRHRPLAMMLDDALNAPSEERRNHALQRLGDVSLFIAGFFADSLANRLVDLDYYIRMGGSAYDSLSDGVRGTFRGRVYGPVFRELGAKFQPLVDVLNEISDSARGSSDHDVLRLYEVWLKTGSRRAARLLGELGVQPSRSARTRFVH